MMRATCQRGPLDGKAITLPVWSKAGHRVGIFDGARMHRYILAAHPNDDGSVLEWDSTFVEPKPEPRVWTMTYFDEEVKP